MRILCVDDERIMLELYKAILEAKGYTVQVATGGVEALKKVEECFIFGKPFDLVILDLKMPDIDGIQVLERIKEKWSNLPVMIVTAFDSKELQNKYCTIYDAYFRKPLKFSEVIKTIKKLLKNKVQEVNR